MPCRARYLIRKRTTCCRYSASSADPFFGPAVLLRRHEKPQTYKPGLRYHSRFAHGEGVANERNKLKKKLSPWQNRKSKIVRGQDFKFINCAFKEPCR